MLIPSNHMDRKFKRKVGGKLIDCTYGQSTKAWPLGTHAMKKEGMKDTSIKVAEKRVAEVPNILQRNRDWCEQH